ncbi:unnamed protein product [Blepharisma stoltei]|uniref:Uncharacterized protein n=1 Tax=Blepharisma stoltei TaxID=1481888 RepID=A0AAU9KB91_9CILI|nr:unnamed protein product [Blepharisma stoltei]
MYRKEISKSAEKPKIPISRLTLPPKPTHGKECGTPNFKYQIERSSVSSLNSTGHPQSPSTTSSTLSRSINKSQCNSPSRNSSPVLNNFSAYSRSALSLSQLYREDVSPLDNEFRDNKEAIKKLESENLRLKNELAQNKEVMQELREKIANLRKESREKDDRIANINALLKESEKNFKNLLETQNSGFDKDKDEKIKDLEFNLKMQKKELTEQFLKEKQELEIKILDLEMLYKEKNSNDISLITGNYLEDLTKQIKLIEENYSKLQRENKELKQILENSSMQAIAKLTSQIEAEIIQLNQVFTIMISQSEISLAMILLAAQSRINPSPSPKTITFSLEKTLQELSIMRTSISDLYAEKCGGSCKIQ